MNQELLFGYLSGKINGLSNNKTAILNLSSLGH